MGSGSRITWLVGGGVVALLLLAGVDALRSSFSDTSAPASRNTSGSGTVTETAGQGMSPAAEEYVAQAQVICGRASSELLRHGVPGNELDELAEWHATAARAAEKSLTQLRALPPPAGQALPDLSTRPPSMSSICSAGLQSRRARAMEGVRGPLPSCESAQRTKRTELRIAYPPAGT